MKPSDIIHNKAEEAIQRGIKTGTASCYKPGYADKLLTAILDYLDEQAIREGK